MKLSIDCHYAEYCYSECRYAKYSYSECRYAEYSYAQCRYEEYSYSECYDYLNEIMNVVMLSVVLPNGQYAKGHSA